MAETCFFILCRGFIMLKKIASGYVRLFSTLGKIIALAAVCLGVAALVVYPLWKWALSSPLSYSWAVIIIIGAGLIAAIVKKSITSGPVLFLRRLAKFVVVVGGMCGCIICVLKGKRIAALIILLAIFILYGILAFGLRDRPHVQEDSD